VVDEVGRCGGGYGHAHVVRRRSRDRSRPCLRPRHGGDQGHAQAV